jgi:hypothetical protein
VNITRNNNKDLFLWLKDRTPYDIFISLIFNHDYIIDILTAAFKNKNDDPTMITFIIIFFDILPNTINWINMLEIAIQYGNLMIFSKFMTNIPLELQPSEFSTLIVNSVIYQNTENDKYKTLLYVVTELDKFNLMFDTTDIMFQLAQHVLDIEDVKVIKQVLHITANDFDFNTFIAHSKDYPTLQQILTLFHVEPNMIDLFVIFELAYQYHNNDLLLTAYYSNDINNDILKGTIQNYINMLHD